MATTFEDFALEFQIAVQQALVDVAAELSQEAREHEFNAQHLAYIFGSAALSAIMNVVAEDISDHELLDMAADYIKQGVEDKLKLLKELDDPGSVVIDPSVTIQ